MYVCVLCSQETPGSESNSPRPRQRGCEEAMEMGDTWVTSGAATLT